jgi:hypothetical protein
MLVLAHERGGSYPTAIAQTKVAFFLATPQVLFDDESMSNWLRIITFNNNGGKKNAAVLSAIRAQGPEMDDIAGSFTKAGAALVGIYTSYELDKDER